MLYRRAENHNLNLTLNEEWLLPLVLLVFQLASKSKVIDGGKVIDCGNLAINGGNLARTKFVY